MGPPDDTQPSLPELGRSLNRLERELTSLRGHVDTRFDRLQSEMTGSIAGLSVVHKDVYDSDQRAHRDYNAETRKIAEASKTLAMWAIGLIVTFALAALAGLIRVSG